jgi:uncharacterized protein YndB with AHSA1/START domain
MAVVTRSLPIQRSAIFSALVDPYTYPHWLVGARAIRSIDDDWPAPGSAFHHRVGLAGPLQVADLTRVLYLDAPRSLTLEVRVRPFGRGRTRFTLVDESGDGPAATRVELDEVPIGLLGPARPVLDPLTVLRNRRSLEQLEAYLLTSG